MHREDRHFGQDLMQRGAKSGPGVPLAPTALTSPEGCAESPLHGQEGTFHVAARPADELPALVPKSVLPQLFVEQDLWIAAGVFDLSVHLAKRALARPAEVRAADEPPRLIENLNLKLWPRKPDLVYAHPRSGLKGRLGP